MEEVRRQKSELRSQREEKPQYRGHKNTEITETEATQRNAEKYSDVRVEWLGLAENVS
jgi:uncharacterized protein YbcC (UPF0753/DUF2309 family)